MSVPANFRLFGVTSDLLKEIEEEFMHFFPTNSVDVNSIVQTETGDKIQNDDENEIGSDDEDNSTTDHDILRSPLIRSRILLAINPPTTETPDSDEGNNVEPHDDDDVNRLDKDVLSRVRETCVKRCLTTMPDTSIIDNRINVQRMDKESRNVFIMGPLKGCGLSNFKGSETRQGEETPLI